MIRAIRRLLFGLGALFVLGTFTVAGLWWFRHLHERTYYGAHSDILPVGAWVLDPQEFAPTGPGPIGRNTSGIARADPAWEEDSCDPERLITVTLSSGEVVSLSRHILHR